MTQTSNERIVILLRSTLPLIPRMRDSSIRYPPLSGMGINGDIAFAEQGEQCPVVGFEVQHDLGELRECQPV